MGLNPTILRQVGAFALAVTPSEPPAVHRRGYRASGLVLTLTPDGYGRRVCANSGRVWTSGAVHPIIRNSVIGGRDRLGALTTGVHNHMWTAPACKGFEDGFGDLAGCGHMSGPLVRRIWPLALMEFADRVPIKIARQRDAR
jgi:hypothetical protein